MGTRRELLDIPSIPRVSRIAPHGCTSQEWRDSCDRDEYIQAERVLAVMRRVIEKELKRQFLMTRTMTQTTPCNSSTALSTGSERLTQ